MDKTYPYLKDLHKRFKDKISEFGNMVKGEDIRCSYINGYG